MLATDTELLLDDIRQALETQAQILNALVGLIAAQEPVQFPELPTPFVEVLPAPVSMFSPDELAAALRPLIQAAPDPSQWLMPIQLKLEELVEKVLRRPAESRGGYGGTVRLAENQTVALTGADLATKANQDTLVALLSGRLPDLTGTWGYSAGVSGTLALTGGKRVIGVTVHCTTAGSMTINGGDSIPIAALSGYVFTPNGQLIDPTFVFTGTDSYAIEYLV